MAKISIDTLRASMKEQTITVPFDGAEAVEITIKRTLPLQEVMEFVDSVVSGCIDIDTGYHAPETMWFLIRSEVLEKYANFELPDDISERYDLLYGTTAFEQVLKHINETQYDEIVEAIYSEITYQEGMAQSLMSSHLKEVVDRMENMADQTAALFGNVSQKEVGTIMHNLSKAGKMDEERLVNAVFEAQKAQEKSKPIHPAVVPLQRKKK